MRGHKLTTTQRGYGWRHQKARQKLKPIVEAGQVVCWRCNEPIQPWEHWDLGHDDEHRDHYRGPEHSECNRGKRKRRGAARERAPALRFFDV
ncbi:hypothetical protein [Mycobacterium sp. 23]|uniref:hypothetical protein n=1 Tax=Mycobacterium sp. 23 TaxID=3400424 RepID=UPI003AAF294D